MIGTGVVTVLVLIASISCASTNDVVFSNSPPLKYYNSSLFFYDPPWGEWEYCGKGEYAVAASAKVDKLEKNKDASAFNGVCIFCSPIGQPFDKSNKSRQLCSKIGLQGDFTEPLKCPFVINGLQVANDFTFGRDIEYKEMQSVGRLFGITTIKFFCSTGEVKEFKSYVQQPFTDVVKCLSGQAICAIRTQVFDASETRKDGAGLMNIQFKCCDVEAPGLVETCKPTDRWEEVTSCNNIHSSSPLECDYTTSVGSTKATMASQTKSMQISMEASASLSVGYNYESELFGLKTDFSATASGSVGKTTGYDWSKESSDTFSSMTTTAAKMTVPARTHSTLFQVVGKCGIFTVYSSALVRVDTKTDGPAPKPTPLPRGFFCDKASNMTAINIPNPNAKDKETTTPPKST